MQTTSSVYQSILQEENHHFEVKLNIAGSDYGQDVIFSMKSDSRLFESSPTIGGTYSGTLEFSLLGDGADIPRMAVVKPYYRAVGASQTSEWLQKGEYYIDTRSVSQNEGGIVVFNAFCYDSMLKANAPYASSSLSWPATPKQVVNEIAGKMGVTITSYASTVLNSNYISIPMPVQYNMREVLGFIAAAYGGNWFIDYEGRLDFKELFMMGLGTAQLAVGTNVSNLNVSPNRGAYTKVILDVDDETAYESGTDETNVLEATCPYATQTVADRVLSELTQYSFLYKPFEAIGCWTDPAVELTDSVTFTDTSVLRPVCARTINFGPAMVMDLTAPNDNDIDHEYAFESPTERNYKRTTARVINQLNVNEEGISLVSEKLNNIGGRNILLDSLSPDPWTTYSGATATFTTGVSVPEWGATDAIRVVGTTANEAFKETILRSNVSQSPATMIQGQKYVASMWLKNQGTSQIYFQLNGGNTQDVAPGESKRVEARADGNGVTYIQISVRCREASVPYDIVMWHPQIEYGEVVTSWTPAPEDIEGEVTNVRNEVTVNTEGITLLSSKVNNIGGRNYLQYSNERSTWRRDFPTSYQPAEIALYSNMVGGKKYTVTIWGDVPTRDGSDGYYSVYWGGGSTPLGNVYISNGKGSVTFTAPTSGLGIGNAWINIYNTADGGGSSHTFTSNITAVKLEEGEVSTDWSAAPEDKTGNNEIIAKINVSPENIVISANKVDLQGYVTFTNLSTSGETAINGGNITTNTISADKLSITDLNAIGATIGGFTIDTSSIRSGALTVNSSGNIGLSTQDFNRTINGTNRTGLRFAIGSNFGVANDGTLYASNGVFSGTITSDSATITGGSLSINTSTQAGASENRIVLSNTYGGTTHTITMRPNLFQVQMVYNGYTSAMAYSDGRLIVRGYDSSSSDGLYIYPNEITYYYNDANTQSATPFILNRSGLVFQDNNYNVTASYPASGLMSIGKAFYNANTDRTVLSNRTAAILANVVRADFEGFKGFSVRYSGGYYYSYFVINPSKVQGEMVVLEVSPYGNGEISIFTIDGTNTITLKRTI